MLQIGDKYKNRLEILLIREMFSSCFLVKGFSYHVQLSDDVEISNCRVSIKPTPCLGSFYQVKFFLENCLEWNECVDLCQSQA